MSEIIEILFPSLLDGGDPILDSEEEHGEGHVLRLVGAMQVSEEHAWRHFSRE